MATMSNWRKASVLIAGGGVYATTVYFAYQYSRMSRPLNETEQEGNCPSHVHNPARTEQFQKVAPCYDQHIGRDEFFMGINLLRWSLIYSHARGNVLEVGAGTARNLSYYPTTVQRILLTDTSDQMLLQAKKKVQSLSPDKKRRFAILQADALSLNLPSSAFDTVVDTFGLCSFQDPVAVLKEMARVCKPDGKILLLEHGRSKSWQFITNHLDRNVENHAANWGCVWNRDLDAILAESGLEVESMSKYHFGTTYYVVCRPPGSAAKAS